MESHHEKFAIDPGIDILSPAAYAEPEKLHRSYARLRKKQPVAWVDQGAYRPFWAVTRHADILEVEKQHELFTNHPRLTLLPRSVEEQTLMEKPSLLMSLRMLFSLLKHSRQRWSDFQSLRRTNARADDAMEAQVRTVIHLDEPEHKKYRSLTQGWFLGRSVSQLEPRIRELAAKHVDRMLEQGGRCDFAGEVAVWYPLEVIMTILGLPPEDAPKLLVWSQQLLSASDPEIQKSDQYGKDVMLEMYAYFSKLIADRRREPTDDLASVVVHAKIDCEPIELVDIMSYFLIVATAGHETTSSAIAGGMLAFAENPDQFELLQKNPEVLKTMADEVVRWVTPVRHFTRTASADYVLRGVNISRGESLAIFYLSANRDEEVFDEPFSFRIERSPNRHLAFGHGVHHCLGRVLASLEIRCIFEELSKRIRDLEPDGEPEWIASNFTGGPKFVPIRFQPA
jgi:cytochrome P450